MRLYTFETKKRQQLIGAELEGRLIDLNAAHAARLNRRSAVLARSMLELICGGERALKQARQALAFAKKNPKRAAACTHDLTKVKVCAPIPRPGKIFCSGLNYRSHVEENPGASFLADPRFFVKVSTAVIGPGEAIRWPGAKFQMDYEVELAVVIGRTASRLSQASVMQHIFGYTILHDVSARWIQFKDKNEDMGKNFDTFAPMGPCIVTADEIPDPAKLHLTLKLNGEVMQDRTNEDWCFPLPRLLEWLTMGTTLEPGDVVSTGTPAGIGFFRQPQVFLQPGDVCELEIDGIGRLVNPVVKDEYKFLTEPKA
ncbi:MAG TPA: fumarylacetoacetate hydrolase family protein [Verrucomicrobiae bacterium]|nr:fumarylacetoacetate hydrolase family protein [Verrucomicrobiae bacterium]